MFCTKCGIQLEESDYFCHRCGTITGRGPSPFVATRLVRTMAGKKIAGVCSGMAEYLNADPVIVRLVWVMITLGLPPAGIIGYIVAWIVIPKGAPAPAPMASVPVPQS